jgi:transposase
VFAKLSAAAVLQRMSKRHELTDEQWEWPQPLLPPQKPKTGRPAEDHRQIINGIR